MLARRTLLLSLAAPGHCLPLGYSLKGFPNLPLPEALACCARLGYGGVELFTAPNQAHAPEAIDARARKQTRELLTRHKLRLHAFMEDLKLPGPESDHQANLAHLAASLQLARDLQPEGPPVVETILGGPAGAWETSRQLFLTRLEDWAVLAERHRVPVAIKAHINNTVHTPEQAVWLLGKINSPYLRLNYDYSHFLLQGLPLQSTLRTALPFTAMVHIKDAAGTPPHHKFLLPTAGPTDFLALATILKDARFQGPVVVEVSTHVLREKDFDPYKAAEYCSVRLRRAFPACA